ncbi:MAG: histone deacetylase [Spirochaetes bacterium]|nr:histone deacetylase [Spirochaetota bacterium]
MSYTAYCFHPHYLHHKTGDSHPESPKRLEILDKYIRNNNNYSSLLYVPPRKANPDVLFYAHDPEYVATIANAKSNGITCIDGYDTVICDETYDVSLWAIGGILEVCDYILAGEATNGFCAIRPPGHHAEIAQAMGFCIFNNVAIAARYLQYNYTISKIAIIDWDAHHGNGTQHIFEADPSVFYISLHQFPFYPGTGRVDEIGIGPGYGYTLNIPMNPGSGDKIYKSAFSEIILPALERFQPEFILISAGFDAHKSDPLSSLNLSSGAYYIFTQMLMGVASQYANNRIVVVLEGGYEIQSMIESVDYVLKALME